MKQHVRLQTRIELCAEVVLQYWIATIFFLISLVAAFGLLWQLFNRKGRRQRSRAPRAASSRFRTSDQVNINRHERETIRRAMAYIKGGEIMAGATLYESIGMAREAIQALEENGFIHDACKILLRMNRPNRAGVLFARNSMWDRAIDCFKIAGMPLEVAKCYRELRNFNAAAPLFEEVGRFKEAAACYKECGQLEKAAELFIEGDEVQSAVKIYQGIGQNFNNLAQLQLRPKALNSVLSVCEQGEMSRPLIWILIAKGRYPELVVRILIKGDYNLALKALSLGNEVGYTQIIADQRFRDELASKTARLFHRCDVFQFAGILYERSMHFAEAADNFERCSEFERAAYCYQRAGNSAKAHDLRGRLSTTQGKVQQILKELDMSSKMNHPEADLARGGVNETDREASDTGRGGNDTARGMNETGRTVNDTARSVNDTARRRSNETMRSPDDNQRRQNNQTFGKVSESERNDFHIFSQTNFVNDLSEVQKLGLFKLGTLKEFSEGEVLLESGVPPLGFYTIIAGGIKCFKVDGSQSQFVDILNPSDSFGEVWLLTGFLAPMRFVAVSHVRILFISSENLFSFFDENGPIARIIYRNFANRLVSQFVHSPGKPEGKKSA